MERLITWFCKNHVAANFLMLLVVVLGVMTWPKIKKESFPETAIDAILISVPFPNATPQEVEKGVIIPIEEAIQDLDGVDAMRSTATQGIASIVVDVMVGYDIRDVMSDIQTRVDTVTNLAEKAEEPMLEQLILKTPVLSLAVSANTTESSLRDLAEQIRTGLLAYEGGSTKITQIKIAGIRDYEISIEISEQKLQQHGLTFDQVALAVRQSSLDLPGGSVRTSTGEVLIRTEARRYTAKEFSNITITSRPDGSTVKLSDIAFIRDDFKEGDVETHFNGQPALLINVLRVGNEDTLKIAETVKKYVTSEIPQILPQGVTVQVWRDDSLLLKGRLDLLVRNGLGGLILVTIVLAMFLRPSLALLVAIGIPVAFCGAVALMPYLGISINLISLFAFILVLGIVVDDAIVIGENVYHRMRQGEPPSIAAIKGTHEVGVVVICGVLTTVMAFTPMLGLSGVSGKIWPNIPLIVIPTLLVSLLQSKFVLPAHLALLKAYNPDEKLGPIMKVQRFFSEGLIVFVDKLYRPSLSLCLSFRWVVLTGFICLLAVSIVYVKNGHIRFEFLPTVEGDVISARIQMSEGVPLETTRRAVKHLTETGLQLGVDFKNDEGNSVIKNVLASAGSQPFVIGFEAVGGVPTATNLGEVTIELVPSATRKFTTDEIISNWREKAGSVPGVVDLFFRSETASGGNAIDLVVTGSDIDLLKCASEELKKGLENIEGVIDVSDSDKEGKREMKLQILPTAEALGLRLQDIANQVRQGFFGEEIQRLQRGKDEVIVYVRYPRNERTSISDLQNSRIRTSNGTEVPFSQVAVASFGRSPTAIHRTDGQRAIRITADVDKGSGANANEVVTSLNQGLETYGERWKQNIRDKINSWFGIPAKVKQDGVIKRIQQTYPGIKVKFQGEQKDQAESVGQIGSKFVIALLGMYILMAVPLKSYTQPLIVMVVIPFGLIGSIIGHVIMGYNLSIMSMCGSIALAGVVVNDSLVLIDYVNREIERGRSIVEAAREAGAARFRAILLTSLTTFAGLVPMLLETDLQARFLIPMAISLSFGILFATIITIILVPCVYLMLNDLKKVLKWAAS